VRVVIRADATRSIGTGHVMRCWALAEEFQAHGWQVSWQGSIDVPWVAGLVAEKGWPVHPPLDQRGRDFCHEEADLVIVDSYGDSDTYRRSALDKGIAVLAVVDHHHKQLGPGSLWVNPGPPITGTGSANFLNGPDYVLIRSEIRALAKMREADAPVSGLTFLLGGTDALGLGEGVKDLDLDEQVVAGPGRGDGGSSGVTWLPPGPDLMREAARSRLVVSPAGVSTWEILHIGAPLALVLAADNQRGNYEWMTEQGWALGLGDGTSLPSRVKEAFRRANEGLLVGEQRIDGEGATRVVEAVLGLLYACSPRSALPA